MTPLEVEAKLSLRRAQDARAIAALCQLGRFQLRVLPSQRLHTIYLDTPTFRLARNGVALRVRRDGSTWEATAKWGDEVTGAVHQRAELTVPLSAPPRFPLALPDGPLATQLTALLAGAKVRPLFITEILRQRRAVIAHDDDAKVLAEIDIDCVTLRRPRQRTPQRPYWEVEVELRNGVQRDVAQLARLLRRRYALSPSPQSKFTRGLGMFYPHVARTVEPPPVAATDTVAEAARKLLGKYLLRVQQHDPGTRTGEDPESNHAMRVAIRHLRAALRVFKAGLPKPLWRNLKDELDWLGKVLGGARDIDVQLAHLNRQKRARANAALEPLRRHLLAQRRRRQAVLRSALNGPRYAQLIAALDAYALAQNDCPKSAAHRGERVLRKEMRRLMTDGRLAMAELTPESLHALRISAKRVRYLVEFFKKLTDQSGKRLTKALVELQDTLGMHHDAAVAIESIRGQLDTLGVSGNRAQAAGLRRFAAAQQRLADRYRRRAQAQWKEFTKARCARDVDRVRRHLTRAADKADG